MLETAGLTPSEQAILPMTEPHHSSSPRSINESRDDLE
jgi:hypothetical protein